MTTYLSLELIESAAKETISGLEQEALRTIRQRNPEKGSAILQEIEGVEDFLQELRMRSRSEISRRNGDVIDHEPGNAKVAQKISEIRHRHRAAS